MNGRYDRLALPTAWRAFQLSRGARMSDLEHRLRELETKVADLNLEREAVHLAAELAALEPDLDDEARFALIVLIVITLAALAQGSTRFPVVGETSREPMGSMLAALIGPNPAECEQMTRSIQAILANCLAPKVIGRAASDRLPLLFFSPFIAHQRSHQVENRLADSIVALNSRPRSVDEAFVRRCIDDVVRRPAAPSQRQIKFSDEQLRAIKTAATARIALISGGPGTGKTSIVVAILRVLARLGVAPAEIALSAPTGRAAFRMAESVATSLAHIGEPSREDETLRSASLDAATVHRLLGYSPGRGTFMHHRNNPLAARVVIVDEASMLDLELMERLLGAVDRGAQLIIMGDSDQLPSVAAGAAFRDLLPSRPGDPLFESSVRLTRNYRTQIGSPEGTAIVEMCRRINAGDTGRALETANARVNADEIEFRGVEMVRGLEQFLARWEREHMRDAGEIDALAGREYTIVDASFSQDDRAGLARLFDYRTRSRILCVTRIGPAGSDAINARMHRRAARSSSSTGRSQQFVAGEPVIVSRNDYERALFNGDQGIIVNACDADGRRFSIVVFNRGDEFPAFRLDALRESIELGYATTVHKAQGSEFDVAALILPDRDLPLMTRELLYTAVSRCRRAATIVGEPQLVAAGIARKAERFSGFAHALSSRVPPATPVQLTWDF